MHSNLYLLDISGYVHAGAVNKHAYLEQLTENGGMWSTQITPGGGLSLVLNTLSQIVDRGDIIACCDRWPTIKQEMIPGYKGNRQHKDSILISKQFVEYVLEDSNILVGYCDGYEADDVIYTYWKQLHELYDHIYIYTMDSDLYFLIDEKTEIMPISSRSKHITLDTYATTVIHGTRFPYNTITVEKIINGDKTDCIPPLTGEARVAAIESFVGNTDLFPQMGDKDVLCTYMLDQPEVIEQINKVFPLDVPALPMQPTEPNKQQLCNWGDAIRNKIYRGRKSPDFNIEEETKKVQELGMYLEQEIL